MAIIEACAIISIAGSLLLGFLGILLLFNYGYISKNINSDNKAGATCLYASGIYLIIFFLALFII